MSRPTFLPAVTIHQPEASNVFLPPEHRASVQTLRMSFSTKYRGLLLVRSSMSIAFDVELSAPHGLVTGAVIGIVDLVEVTQSRGGYLWRVDSPHTLKSPFRIRPGCGIWTIGGLDLERILAQLPETIRNRWAPTQPSLFPDAC